MSPRIDIEAHRGDSANAPENTMAAFRRAVALGVPSIELDVHPSRDGVLMVIHDATVDRTTNGSGVVGALSSEDLHRLDAGRKYAAEFAGERIPRLEEVFELLEPTRTRLNVEIKASPPGMDVPAMVVELLRRFGKERQYVVSSFDLRPLLQVRAMDPGIALALIGIGPEILPKAHREGLPWIHANHATVTASLVAKAHALGLSVNIWTMDDPARLDHWREVGVDKVCTNRPADMLATLSAGAST